MVFTAITINSHAVMFKASRLFPEGVRLSLPFSLFLSQIVFMIHIDSPVITRSNTAIVMLFGSSRNDFSPLRTIVSTHETIVVMMKGHISFEKYLSFFLILLMLHALVFLYYIFFLHKVNLFSHSKNFIIYFFSI